MNATGIFLLSLVAVNTAPATTGNAPVHNVQRVGATVTIIAAEPIDARTPPQRGSSQATTRQYRERNKVPLVEFF